MNANRKKTIKKLSVALLTAIFVILFTQNPWLSIKPLTDLEQKFIDSRFYFRGLAEKKSEPNVVIVEITDNTYNQIPAPYNNPPLPRSLFARMIKNLTNAGARVIGIDIILAQSDKYSTENDSLFFQTIKETKNVVLAGQIYENIEQHTQTKNLKENYGNHYYFADSCIGIVQIDQDPDGVLRRYIPYFYYSKNDELIPSFAFSILNKFYGKPNRYIAENNLLDFVYSGKSIPKYNKNSFLINFYGSDNYFRSVDLIDIIDDSTFQTQNELDSKEQFNMWDSPDYGLLHSGLFKDKIVLVGSRNYLDRDIIHVSYSDEFDTLATKQQENRVYGVMVHAAVVENIITGAHIKAEPFFLSFIILLAFTLGSFYLTSLPKKIIIKYSLIAEFINIIIIAGLFYLVEYLSFYFFVKYSYLTSIVNPCFALLFGYISSSAYEFFTEKKQKGMIKKIFSQYVSSAVVDELISNPDKVSLKGEAKFITALFSDIEGFSTFSEKMDPKQLVSFLNDYFDEMTKIVIDENGTLDKFIGDSVMAFWGAPLTMQNHALPACRAAIRMQNKLDELQAVWSAKGFPSIRTRIGVNTGEMVVGNVGGEKRFNYTIMGNQVNIASRLEGINKNFGTRIIISQSTYELVNNVAVVKELGKIAPKGISEEIKIFELIDIK